MKGMNATMGGTKGSNPALASVISFSVGTVACFVVLLIWIRADFRTIDFGAIAKEAPWWSWLGGIMGALVVVVFVLTIPRMGSGTVLAVFVCSQVIMACINDQYSIVGVPHRTFTVWRGLGIIGLVLSVFVISRY